MTTPPVGLNLYVASGITRMPLYDGMKAAAPWLLVVVFTLLVVTYVPEISLLLPRLLYRWPARFAGRVSYIRSRTTRPEAKVRAPTATTAVDAPKRSATRPASSAPRA